MTWRVTSVGPWKEDMYHVHDGGCTMGGFQRDLASVSDCSSYSGGGCDCAVYSGVTHTVDAQVRTRRVHTLKRGDLVIIQGVTGTDAHLLNKQHTVGASTSTARGSLRICAQPTLNQRTESARLYEHSP